MSIERLAWLRHAPRIARLGEGTEAATSRRRQIAEPASSSSWWARRRTGSPSSGPPQRARATPPTASRNSTMSFRCSPAAPCRRSSSPRPLAASDLLLLRRIRELSPRTAVVVVTKTPTDPDLKRAFESGATAFLSWPASNDAVRHAIDRGTPWPRRHPAHEDERHARVPARPHPTQGITLHNRLHPGHRYQAAMDEVFRVALRDLPGPWDVSVHPVGRAWFRIDIIAPDGASWSMSVPVHEGRVPRTWRTRSGPPASATAGLQPADREAGRAGRQPSSRRRWGARCECPSQPRGRGVRATPRSVAPEGTPK